MSDDQPKQRSAADAELEREIRQGRTFSMAEAIGRLAGPGMMKGASPIVPQRQAEAQVEDLIKRHLEDDVGVLPGVLFREVKEGRFLLDGFHQPQVALADHVRNILASDQLLKDLVRATDMEWGRIYGERPHFDRDGQPPHPDDPYTVAAVHGMLSRFLARLT